MELICINCPNGCRLKIQKEGDDFKVEGNPHIEISGGRFNRELDPSYLAPGYKQVLVNGFYTVQKEE